MVLDDENEEGRDDTDKGIGERHDQNVSEHTGESQYAVEEDADYIGENHSSKGNHDEVAEEGPGMAFAELFAFVQGGVDIRIFRGEKYGVAEGGADDFFEKEIDVGHNGDN